MYKKFPIFLSLIINIYIQIECIDIPTFFEAPFIIRANYKINEFEI